LFLPLSASQLRFPRADAYATALAMYVSSNTYPRTAKIWSIGESYGFRSTDARSACTPTDFRLTIPSGASATGHEFQPAPEGVFSSQMIPRAKKNFSMIFRCEHNLSWMWTRGSADIHDHARRDLPGYRVMYNIHRDETNTTLSGRRYSENPFDHEPAKRPNGIGTCSRMHPRKIRRKRKDR
jgi:hypothetical protein